MNREAEATLYDGQLWMTVFSNDIQKLSLTIQHTSEISYRAGFKPD